MEFIFLFGLIQAVIVGAFCGYIAGQKNRSQGSWFVLGFLFSFLALLALIAVPKIEEPIYRQSIPTLAKPVPMIPSGTAERTCPFCAETIKAAAKVCRFCQRDLVPPVAERQIKNGPVVQTSVHNPEVDWSTKDEIYCAAALKEMGFEVAFSAPSKWHINSPTGKSTSYAYSLKDLQRIAERETKI